MGIYLTNELKQDEFRYSGELAQYNCPNGEPNMRNIITLALCLCATPAFAQNTHVESKQFSFRLQPGQQISNALTCNNGELISGGYNLDNKNLDIEIDENYPTDSSGLKHWRAGVVNKGTGIAVGSYDIMILCSEGKSISSTPPSGTIYLDYVTHQIVKPNGTVDVHNIYSVAPDGTSLTALTSSDTAKEFDNQAAAVSPDGSKIAFTTMRHREEPAHGNHSEIYVMDPDGSNQTRLTFNQGKDDAGPRWCGNDRIIFSQNGNIIEMDAADTDGDGNGDNAITVLDASIEDTEYFDVDCAPDGSKILFLKAAAGSTTDIIVANRDGTSQVSLGGASEINELPRFSPDGTRIAFGSMRAQPHSGIRDIFTMDATDTNGDGLGDNLTRLTISTQDSGSSNPSWSPDGNFITFSKSDNGGFSTYYVDVQGLIISPPIAAAPNNKFPADWH